VVLWHRRRLWLTGKLQKWLSVSGTVAGEKAMAYRQATEMAVSQWYCGRGEGYGLQASYRNGCQSVVLWHGRRLWLTGKLQKWLSVSGTVAREKATTPVSGFKNLLELKLAFKVITVLDSGLGHQQDHDHTNPNIQVECLSKNTTILLL